MLNLKYAGFFSPVPPSFLNIILAINPRDNQIISNNVIDPVPGDRQEKRVLE